MNANPFRGFESLSLRHIEGSLLGENTKSTHRVLFCFLSYCVAFLFFHRVGLVRNCGSSPTHSTILCIAYPNPSLSAKKYHVTFDLVFFYPSRRLGISSRDSVHLIKGVKHLCISSRISVHILQLDDIQCFVLMIYNFFKIDDIHPVG